MTVHRAIARVELPSRTERGRVFIDETDLERWIARREAGSRATPLAGALDYVQTRLCDPETSQTTEGRPT